MRALIIGALALGACSLAEDVTPPPALATAQMAGPIPTAEVATQEPSFALPPRPPDPAAGRAIYLESCSPCHGAQGLGDGELVGNLDFPPSPLGDPEFARNANLRDWYQVVTVGNLERLMPGFASLSDMERWDVVAYALTLSNAAADVGRGKLLFEQTCVECHATDGSDFDLLSQSGEELMASLGAQAEHTFASELVESELWDVVHYVRTLAFQSAQLVEEPVEDPEISGGVVLGQVRNGTPGFELPPDLELLLTGIEGENEVVSVPVEAGEDGTFIVEDLETAPGRLFFVTANYQGITYQSELAHFLPGESTLELPITIYESMSSPDPIRVDRLHYLFDLSVPETIRVIELWVLSNLSDRALVPDGADPVVEVELPPDAFNLVFEEGQLGGRFQLTGDGFGDYAPMVPGAGVRQLIFSFDLPYESGLELETRLGYPVQAVVLLMPEGGPRLRGEGIQDLGIQDMGGIRMVNYAAASIPAGGRLALTFSGRHPAGQTAAPSTEVLAGAGVFVLAAGVTAYFWFLRSRRMDQAPVREPARAASKQELINAMARLDIEYEAGEIDRDAYARRRAELKSQVEGLMHRD